ncbi:hypothetical protein PIB30_057595 [Stylosanthes scabra]|uniref:Uncharacterized protein n=1 Tax=Stylosanthes scabra TaxID=79078 RepID=A0ABU6UJ21_9FABA|nr:hypothetical protein [Stylosanthes scabra]
MPHLNLTDLETLEDAAVEAAVHSAAAKVQIAAAGLELAAKVGAIQPPPALPDMTLLTVEDGEPKLRVLTEVAKFHGSEDVKDALIGVHSGTEDSTVVKGKVDATDLDNSGLGWRESEPAEATDISHGVRTSSNSDLKCPASKGAILTATVTSGGLARKLRRFFLLTPLPLLAAIFSWNRGGEEEERSRDAWNWSAETDKVAMVVKRMDCAIDGTGVGGTVVAVASLLITAKNKKEEKGIGPLFFRGVNVENDEGNVLPPLPHLGLQV